MTAHGGRRWWAPIVHFATHSAIGSAIFIVIALPALGLGRLVVWMEEHRAAPYVVGLFTFLEYAIATLDVILVLTYLTYAAVKAAKELR